MVVAASQGLGVGGGAGGDVDALWPKNDIGDNGGCVLERGACDEALGEHCAEGGLATGGGVAQTGGGWSMTATASTSIGSVAPLL